MSGSVIRNSSCSVPLVRRSNAIGMSGVCGQRGIGMLEFLIALMIFSMGMMGLLSAQLAGKKAGYEASQRSVATALARDILERMRANPGQIEFYQVSDVGDEQRRLPEPGADCAVAVCSAAQLAAFDLWQWESLLVGESETFADGNAGGLLSPRACITRDGGEVGVAISWLGTTTAGQVPAAICGAASGANPEPSESEKGARRRHQLAITTFIGGR